jgi:hypothetical protein
MEKKPMHKRWYVWLIGLVVIASLFSPMRIDKPDAPSLSIEQAAPNTTQDSSDDVDSTDNQQENIASEETQEQPLDTAESTESLEQQDATPAEEPVILSEPEPQTTPPAPIIVYITNSGKKYHNAGCSYLRSSNEITLENAKARGYTPCSRCRPPE